MIDTSTTQASRGILIVEDEGIVAADIAKNLGEMSFEVCGIAGSCGEALRLARETRPDLVLMDVRIRGEMDGIQTAELLRQQQALPIVYLTAHGDQATLERAKRTEPLAFLTKPFRKTELRSAIELALARHAMEVRLRERERWLATTLRSIGDAVITVDVSGGVMFINQAAEQITGVSAAKAIGAPIERVLRLVDTSGNSLAAEPVRQALNEGRVVSFHTANVVEANDGRAHAVTARAAPVMDAGQVIGGVVVLANLTEQQRIERLERQAELERLRSELAEARVAERDEFMAVAAHELRTPLSALQLGLQSARHELAKKGLPAESRLDARLEAALRHTQRLNRLTEQLVDASGLVGNRLEVVREELDLGRFISAIIEDFREPARDAKCELRFNSREGIVGSWDRARLEQAIINVLSNALKYGAGSPVELAIDRVGGEARLTVSDRGIGVAPADQERIFGRYERAAPVRHFGGLGLGLYIARRLVQAHGGTLCVNAREGGGSTFEFRLPLGLDASRSRRPEEAPP